MNSTLSEFDTFRICTFKWPINNLFSSEFLGHLLMLWENFVTWTEPTVLLWSRFQQVQQKLTFFTFSQCFSMSDEALKCNVSVFRRITSHNGSIWGRQRSARRLYVAMAAVLTLIMPFMHGLSSLSGRFDIFDWLKPLLGCVMATWKRRPLLISPQMGPLLDRMRWEAPVLRFRVSSNVAKKCRIH